MCIPYYFKGYGVSLYIVIHFLYKYYIEYIHWCSEYSFHSHKYFWNIFKICMKLFPTSCSFHFWKSENWRTVLNMEFLKDETLLEKNSFIVGKIFGCWIQFWWEKNNIATYKCRNFIAFSLVTIFLLPTSIPIKTSAQIS